MERPPQCLSLAVDRETSSSKVLWSARPDPRAFARNGSGRAIIGIPFTAFAILWTWGASGGLSSNKGKSAPPFFVLWGCMFIIIGLCILLSPVFAFWKAGRMFYVVTDKAAIIFERTWSLKIHSFDASALGGFERVSRGDRAGDIVFKRNIERRGKGTSVSEVGFIGLRDFSEAEQALRSMIENQKKSP